MLGSMVKCYHGAVEPHLPDLFSFLWSTEVFFYHKHLYLIKNFKGMPMSKWNWFLCVLSNSRILETQATQHFTLIMLFFNEKCCKVGLFQSISLFDVWIPYFIFFFFIILIFCRLGVEISKLMVGQIPIIWDTFMQFFDSEIFANLPNINSPQSEVISFSRTVFSYVFCFFVFCVY